MSALGTYSKWGITAILIGCACGGGGGGGGGGGSTAITSSSEWASSAVASVNGGVGDVVQAKGGQGLPTTLVRSSVIAHILSAPRANESGTIDCSTLGTGGSGTISYSATTSGSQLTSISWTYNSCSWSNATESYSINGTAAETYTNYTSSSDFTFSVSWNITYSYSGAYSASGTYDGSESCTVSNSAYDCSYDFGSYAVKGTISVSTSGDVTTVSSATVSTTVSGSSGGVTIVYSDWVYDSSLGYATSGTATITDSSGDTATVTATGSGHYTVVVTVSGASATYML